MNDQKPCAGMNCGTTTAEHSKECVAQHAAAVAGGVFVKGHPAAWDVRNVEISYRAIFATEREAKAMVEQHDEAGYSQATITPLYQPEQ